MMRKLLSVLASSLVAVGIVGAATRPIAIAQDSAKPAAKTEKGGEAKGAKKVNSGDRLPPNYAKIGLSEEQRKKIYEVQNKYEAQIDALEKQIADLKAKQTGEVEGVLTPEQHKALQALIEESKKKAAEKKKSGEAKSGEAKKSDK
jgi:Spy/CpxP family protein refolding chaperone